GPQDRLQAAHRRPAGQGRRPGRLRHHHRDRPGPRTPQLLPALRHRGPARGHARLSRKAAAPMAGALRGETSLADAPSFETIRYELDQGVLTITLNRPDVLNALNDQMAKDLLAALKQAGRDDQVRALII